MPWETPGPPAARSQQPIIANPPAAAGGRRQSSKDVKMPWDPPGGAPAAAAKDTFAAETGEDKGLDEVILEYLSDDGEPEER